MRITKYAHSCLLVEHDEKVVLIDPGQFSWPAIDLDNLPELDAVLLTHIHSDHYYPEALRQIVAKFPEIQIIGTDEIAQTASEEELFIDVSMPDWVRADHGKHPELLWNPGTTQNNSYHVFDLLTHGGDTHALAATMPVLAFAITAPWGSLSTALENVLSLKPQTVLPIHDWHLNEEARQWYYAQADKVCKGNDIKFIAPENGVSINIDV